MKEIFYISSKSTKIEKKETNRAKKSYPDVYYQDIDLDIDSGASGHPKSDETTSVEKSRVPLWTGAEWCRFPFPSASRRGPFWVDGAALQPTDGL